MAVSLNSLAGKEPLLQLTRSVRLAPSSPCPLVSIGRRSDTNLFNTVLRKPSGLSIVPVSGGLVRPLLAKSEPFACRVGYAVADSPVAVEDEELDISKLGIDGGMVAALARRGIHHLFPIQKAVLEPAMQGRDMIGRAKTGTGKTLAFGLPILDKIIQHNAKNGRGRNPLALVMAPTRELACQVEKEFRLTAPRLATVCCYGGAPISNQLRMLRNGVDVVVGTPGRITDLAERGALNLSQVQFVVLDEADQMLAVGFEEAVEEILRQLPKQRQSMMFSATMPPFIRSLTRKYLKNPVTIDLVGDSDQKLAEGISLYSVATSGMGKASILGPLITQYAKGGKSIVFTRTKRDANDLAYAMSAKYRCKALHGDISQAQRERALAGFRDGRFDVLIATDVASRGLDIPNVDLIVHYELPNTSEIFVHRSGRTGRAGKKGSAILMYTNRQVRDVKLIEREIGCRFTELPKIQGDSDLLDAMSDGSRQSSSGGYGDRGYGGQGGSRFGRPSSGGYSRSSGSSSGGYSRSGGSSSGDYGRSPVPSPGRMGGGYGESRSGRMGGGYGERTGRVGGGYGERTGRSSSQGGSRFDRSGSSSGGYGRSSGGYGRSSSPSSGQRGGYGSGRGGYGDEFGSRRSGSGISRGGRFDDFEDSKDSLSDSGFWKSDSSKDSANDPDALGGANGYW